MDTRSREAIEREQRDIYGVVTIKCCPICQENDTDNELVILHDDAGLPVQGIRVECQACHFGGPAFREFTDALDAWNNIPRVNNEPPATEPGRGA